jgi:UDP-N-acetylmuramoylalanine--D-glutamate ligase
MRKVLVIGMEKTGMASVEFLRRQGAHVTAADQRPVSIPWPDVPFQLQDQVNFQAFDTIVLSPGVPADLPGLNAAGSKAAPNVIGEVELAAPYLKGRTIGITGSNGKTTTTALAGHILQSAGVPSQVGGNIGTPVIAMVATSREGQWNVLELSSFQLETIRTFRADVGVALNVTQNHLDRHHTFQRYAAAKGNLFRTQRAGDVAILNADDPTCVSFGALTLGRTIWFSSARPRSDGLWLEGGRIWYDGVTLMPAADVPLRGRHNLDNVMAAAAAARVAGVELPAISAAVRTFQAVEHRLEFVRELSGIDFYNDSKATSVDATIKALDAFDSTGLWVILGGKDKGSDYRLLRDRLSAKARAALLIGAAAPKIAEHLAGAVALIDAGTLDAAVREAYRLATSGDTVLLAPACASFDQFQSFEHRGRAFKETVQELSPK